MKYVHECKYISVSCLSVKYRGCTVYFSINLGHVYCRFVSFGNISILALQTPAFKERHKMIL